MKQLSLSIVREPEMLSVFVFGGDFNDAPATERVSLPEITNQIGDLPSTVYRVRIVVAMNALDTLSQEELFRARAALLMADGHRRVTTIMFGSLADVMREAEATRCFAAAANGRTA